MARFVSSILPSMRRTSWSRLMSLARECFFRSASFSSSSMIGFSKSRGGSFMGGQLFEGYGITLAQERGEFLQRPGLEDNAAAGWTVFGFFIQDRVQRGVLDA